MKLDELIQKYLKLRDAKSELEAKHKQETSRYTQAMAKIEKMLLAEFNETGQDSAKTGAGTAYKTIRTSAKVADRDAFFDFVRESESWAFLESRVNKTAVEEYLQEHEQLPPGVDVTRSATINIRRS
jgi:hypothetical protein